MTTFFTHVMGVITLAAMNALRHAFVLVVVSALVAWLLEYDDVRGIAQEWGIAGLWVGAVVGAIRYMFLVRSDREAEEIAANRAQADADLKRAGLL